MPRPQYTQEELTQLANRYQAQAYPYIEGLGAQLYELDHDETRPQGSRAYLARKAHLNSQIYLMTRYAMDARQNIEQGYPPKFHADSIRNLSNRLYRACGQSAEPFGPCLLRCESARHQNRKEDSAGAAAAGCTDRRPCRITFV